MKIPISAPFWASSFQTGGERPPISNPRLYIVAYIEISWKSVYWNKSYWMETIVSTDGG